MDGPCKDLPNCSELGVPIAPIFSLNAVKHLLEDWPGCFLSLRMNLLLVLELVKLSNFYCFVWQTALHPNDFLQETEPPGSNMLPCHICY